MPESLSAQIGDDDFVICPDCGGSDPARWFCSTCHGEGGWEPGPHDEPR